jgi:hypothetical protein
MVTCAMCIYHTLPFLNDSGQIVAYCKRPDYKNSPGGHSSSTVKLLDRHNCSSIQKYRTEEEAKNDFKSRLGVSIGLDPMG